MFEPPAFAGFGDWHVVKVLTPDATTPQLTDLGSLSASCFSVHDTDASWQQDVADILRECGYSILHPDHVNDENQLQLLKPLVSSGDVGFCRLLHSAQGRFGPNDGATELRLKILRFLASRRDDFFDQLTLDLIRAMRLFLVSSPQGDDHYISLSDASKTFVCLRKDPTATYDRVPSMMALDLSDLNVGFLSLPPSDCLALYKRLGVETDLLTSDFVVRFICPALAKAARRGASAVLPVLKAVHSWWDRNEDDTLRTKIKDAVKEVAFIIPSAGGDPVKASSLIDPNQPVAMAFAEVLGDKVPCADMKDFLPLLKRLGMLSFLPARLVERCAIVLNSSAVDGPVLSESTQSQALLLFDALCHGFKDVFEARKKEKEAGQKQRLCSGQVEHIEKHLVAAAGMRIALVHSPCYGADASQFASTLAKSMSYPFAPFRPSPLHSQLQLSSVHDLILTADTEAICWTQRKMLARHADLTVFNALVQSFPRELAQALDCYCSPSDLPLRSLINHLIRLSSIPDLHRFRAYTALAQEFEQIFKVLDGRASEMEAAHVQALTRTACVPLRIDHDASGKLSESSAKITLEVPSQCFFTLKHTEEQELRGYVHRWPEPHSLSPLRSCIDVAKTLGVRPELAAKDLVECIHAIASAAAGQCLTEAEERAARFALQTLLRLCQETTPAEPYSLWLFASDQDGNRLVKADKLVWVDRVEFEERCTNLQDELGFSFMSKQSASHQSDKVVNWDGELLCKISALRPLSSLLTEVLLDGHDCLTEAPSYDEQCFQALLTSHQFVDGSRACLDNLSAEQGEAHDQLLANIGIRWTPSQLQSVLYAKADCPAERKLLAGSDASTYAFAEGSTLWLQSGILGQRALEGRLFDEVATSLFKMIQGAGIPAVRHGHFPSVLECYTQGPAAIAVALKRRSVAVDNRMMTERKRAPGVTLDVMDHEHLQHSMDFTFDADELVAVSTGVDEHHVAQYKYARVLPYAESTSCFQ